MRKFAYVVICLFLLVGCHKEETKKVSSSINTIDYDELETYFNKFQCGDIINIENTHYLSNLAIPGKWKHTLIYIGTIDQMKQIIQPNNRYFEKIINKYKNGDEILVLDANSTGVKIRLFKDMANLKNDSYLKALVCYRLEKDNTFIQSFIEKAMDYYDTPYDFEMNSKDDSALYCSELIYFALLKNDIKLTNFSKVLEYQIITPTNLIEELKEKNLVKEIVLLEGK